MTCIVDDLSQQDRRGLPTTLRADTENPCGNQAIGGFGENAGCTRRTNLYDKVGAKLENRGHQLRAFVSFERTRRANGQPERRDPILKAG